jgi:hypothetical protein
MSLSLLNGGMRLAETEALVTYIKSAVHLKELSVNLYHADKNLRSMLTEALRVNGSVVDVGEGMPRTYCVRNSNLRSLLEQRPMPSTDLFLIPMLFQISKVAEKMAPNMLFMGLLGCDDLGTTPQGQLRTRPR